MGWSLCWHVSPGDCSPNQQPVYLYRITVYLYSQSLPSLPVQYNVNHCPSCLCQPASYQHSDFTVQHSCPSSLPINSSKSMNKVHSTHTQCQDFFLPPCMSTGAWRRGRLVAGSGRQCRTCDLRAGVVADRILNGSILPLGQVSCVQAALSVAELFVGQWH